MASLQKNLQKHFGFENFRSGQEEVIQNLLDGHSALAIFPTGAGKSICYQLPAILLEGVTLVISPLIALMKDQVEALHQKNICAARIDSSLTAEEWETNQAAIKSGKIKLLYVSPERFANESFRKWVKTLRISLMAIDEAHCLSEWGHNFRPDYLKLPKIAKQLKAERVLCLTATATKKVSQDIRRAFKIPTKHVTKTPFERPHLQLNVLPVDSASRDNILLEKVQQHPNEATIIYVTQQATSEKIASYLQKHQLSVQAFHAGLDTDTKQRVQNNFMQGRTTIIVATIAFGMGVDKANIRHIYHYNLPKTIENYIQETGRAGRDRKTSTCTLLACGNDLITLEGFILGNTPSPAAIKNLLEFCTISTNDLSIDKYHLSTSLDISPIVIDTILTYLELRNILESKGSRYTTYKAKLLRPLQHILAGHNPNRVRFLKKLFEAANVYKNIYYTFDTEQAAQELQTSPQKIAQSIEWLESHGDITLRPMAPRQLYKIKKSRQEYNLSELIQDLQETFLQREKSELDRLNQVIEFIKFPRCLSQYILNYFGEKDHEPCGNCTSCHTAEKTGNHIHTLRSQRRLPLSSKPPFKNEDLERIHLLLKENHVALGTARQLARFLTGLKSPALRKHKLYSHSLYAVWDEHLFSEVLTQCDILIPERR